MKHKLRVFGVFLTLSVISLNSLSQEIKPIEVLLLGTIHFNQFHNEGDVNRDFLGSIRQNEFADVTKRLRLFNPDAIFVEREPSSQHKLDSLFQLPIEDLNDLSDGRSELYQIGFRLAKELGHPTVYGVDYYESVSQGLLNTGNNIDLFNDALNNFRNMGRSITKNFLEGKLTIKQFLFELNRPENIDMSHQLFYNTPAYVQNGSFNSYEGLRNEIDTTQIGAEFISIFYERNLKIYANILNKQQETGARRIIVIVGQVHVGVLKDIMKNNPKFTIVETNRFLID